LAKLTTQSQNPGNGTQIRRQISGDFRRHEADVGNTHSSEKSDWIPCNSRLQNTQSVIPEQYYNYM